MKSSTHASLRNDFAAATFRELRNDFAENRLHDFLAATRIDDLQSLAMDWFAYCHDRGHAAHGRDLPAFTEEQIMAATELKNEVYGDAV